jgi:oxygen-dependent protoporphyrinogen oxidase
VVVVGAGLSGLSTGFYLRREIPDAHVLILESASKTGGLIGTYKQDGFLVELGPNGFLDSREDIVQLCHELGLGDRLERANESSANRFVLSRGKLRRLPATPFEFLRSDILSWTGKLAFLSERILGKPSKADDESIADFGRRHFGSEATDVMLDAIVTGIFAGDYEKLSMPACFPRIIEWEREFGSILKAQAALARKRKQENKPASSFGGTLTAPQGGMQVLIEALERELSAVIARQHHVRSVEKSDVQWSVRSTNDSQPTVCDAVILACPSWKQATLFQHDHANEESRQLAELLRQIPSAPAVVVALGYRQQDLPDSLPMGFGYLAPERLGRPVLGVIFSSCVFSDQAPVGSRLFRAILGGDRRRDVIDWSDEQLVEAVRDDLSALLDVHASPTFQVIQRWPNAIPQYTLGHLSRVRIMEGLAQKMGGLFLTGYSFHGAGVADCVREGKATAKKVAEYFSRKHIDAHDQAPG